MRIKHRELCVYLSYICLYVSLFMGDIYQSGMVSYISMVMRFVSYGLIVLSTFQFKLRGKDYLVFALIMMLTLIYGLTTRDFYWSVLALLIYNSKKIMVNNIFKISFAIIVCGSAVVILLCAIGVLPDVITARNSLITSDYSRHSLGFYHSNVLPLLVLYMEVYYVILKKDKLKLKVIFAFLLFSILLNLICNSRNAFILSCMLFLLVLFEKYKKKKKILMGVMYKISTYSVPVIAGFSYAMMFLLLRGGIWNTIDTFFSGRFRLAIFKMRRIGLHLINIMSNEAFASDNITYVNGTMLHTVQLDNGYLYIFLRYGILMVFFYILVANLLSKKAKGNFGLLGVLFIVFFANFVDNDLVDYSFLPFILWAFNDLPKDGMISRMKSKIQQNKRLRAERYAK